MRTRVLLLTILAFTFTITGNAQGNRSRIKHSNPASASPYVLIDSFETEMQWINAIEPEQVESVNVLKGVQAQALYGDKAKAGAIIVKTKPGTDLLRLNAILDKYNIPAKDRKLRVAVNNTLIKDPQLMLISASQLLGVEITSDIKWVNTEDANTTERFLNIKIADKSSEKK